jgi:VanZ family protein
MMTFMKQTISAAMPYFFWLFLCLVTFFMLLELPPKHGGWPYWDKVQHLVVFAVLTTLAFTAYPKWRWGIVALLVAYGGLVEWMQAVFTVTRMPSLGDWLADAAGVLLMVIAFRWVAVKRQLKAPV